MSDSFSLAEPAPDCDFETNNLQIDAKDAKNISVRVDHCSNLTEVFEIILECLNSEIRQNLHVKRVLKPMMLALIVCCAYVHVHDSCVKCMYRIYLHTEAYIIM